MRLNLSKIWKKLILTELARQQTTKDTDFLVSNLTPTIDLGDGEEHESFYEQFSIFQEKGMWEIKAKSYNFSGNLSPPELRLIYGDLNSKMTPKNWRMKKKITFWIHSVATLLFYQIKPDPRREGPFKFCLQSLGGIHTNSSIVHAHFLIFFNRMYLIILTLRRMGEYCSFNFWAIKDDVTLRFCCRTRENITRNTRKIHNHWHFWKHN